MGRVGKCCRLVSNPQNFQLIGLKTVVETNREEFLEHPVAVFVVASAVVVETRM